MFHGVDAGANGHHWKEAWKWFDVLVHVEGSKEEGRNIQILLGATGEQQTIELISYQINSFDF